jgi:hypothetical protein
MSEEFSSYTNRVTLGDDGVYRWYYDMDMYRNKSMLYTLEKINLFIFLGVSLGGALFVGFMAHDFHASIVRGILLIGLAMGALMALLYVIGFYAAAWIKRGNYRIRFAMREDGIELIWSDRLKEGLDTGRKVMALAGAAVGSRGIRGRWRPTLDEVSKMSFSTVFRCKSYLKWNMIDLSMLGGKFQVYASDEDFEWVERFILERIPQRASRAVR